MLLVVTGGTTKEIMKNTIATGRTKKVSFKETGTSKGYYQATVDVLCSDRCVSDFMASAGLGLTGGGYWRTMTIDYKKGEQVDTDRVSRAMDNVIEESNKTNTEFKILSYKVNRITLIPV
jgi:hypothetical protein